MTWPLSPQRTPSSTMVNAATSQSVLPYSFLVHQWPNTNASSPFTTVHTLSNRHSVTSYQSVQEQYYPAIQERFFPSTQVQAKNAFYLRPDFQVRGETRTEAHMYSHQRFTSQLQTSGTVIPLVLPIQDGHCVDGYLLHEVTTYFAHLDEMRQNKPVLQSTSKSRIYESSGMQHREARENSLDFSVTLLVNSAEDGTCSFDE